MDFTVFDIETDGLLPEVTKLHIGVEIFFSDEGHRIFKKHKEDWEFREYMFQHRVLVGHNIIKYDLPVLEKLFGIKYEGQVIDTLALSYYLNPLRESHSLESYGKEYNIPKIKIENWKDLTESDYFDRCYRDVEINAKLFRNQWNYLMELYNNDEKEVLRLINYLNFKFQCLKDQEKEGVWLNTEVCSGHIEKLENILSEKILSLSEKMPKELGTIWKTKPKKIINIDGSMSSLGQKWYRILEEKNLPLDTEVIKELPNPLSSDQLKKWLFSLGWKPITYKDGANGKVPQVTLPFGQGLCPSVKELFEEHPVLEELDGIYMLRHRRGVLSAFMENKDKDDHLYSTAHGFTNTLRLMHSNPIVNLPRVSSSYGKEIRECLSVKDENYIMFGADISALEDSCKQHWIYFYDPEYVNQMRVPGFDPHIDMAILSNMMSEKEGELYKRLSSKTDRTSEENLEYKRLHKIRSTAKNLNFAAVYGSGVKTLAKTGKISEKEAKNFKDTYWKRNNAVLQVVKDVERKIVKDQLWVKNPISNFWYFVKVEKDIFSTLNQGSGVYVFDTWLKQFKTLLQNHNIHCNIWLQYHDEMSGICHKGDVKRIENLLSLAMKNTNSVLKLNVPISFSIDWGRDYAEVH